MFKTFCYEAYDGYGSAWSPNHVADMRVDSCKRCRDELPVPYGYN